MGTRLITPIGILSYPHLDKPQPGVNGGEPKYSITLVFDKEAQATPQFAAMQAAAIEAATETFGATMTVSGKKISIEQALKVGAIKNPFRKDETGMKGYPEGAVYVGIRSSDQPQLIRADKSLVDQKDIRDTFYPGSKARASVVAGAYNKEVNKGVTFYLGNVQKTGEGERLDSRKTADQDFDALDVQPEDLDNIL